MRVLPQPSSKVNPARKEVINVSLHEFWLSVLASIIGSVAVELTMHWLGM